MTRDDPVTLAECDAELARISDTLRGTPTRTLGKIEKAPLIGRYDHLLDLRPALT